MSDRGIPCLWMRGGTSKGAYFIASDLPGDLAQRDDLLLRIMGSPDPFQIDGIGGGSPLTSKVAILSPSIRPDADIDYLFLQVFVERALVSAGQPCGNILAAVGPAALERGLIRAEDESTTVRIHMVNTGEIAIAQVETPGRQVTYRGSTSIAGVPGTHAPVRLVFRNIAGSMSGQLLPTGNVVDVIEGVQCTLIDNGMPVVVLCADDVGVSGYEDPSVLEGNAELVSRIEAIRIQAGKLMNLGDVTQSSSPKVALVAAPRGAAAICIRCFIPHRVHTSIGVFAAISVATAALLPGSPISTVVVKPKEESFIVEHPTGTFEVLLEIGSQGEVSGAGTIRTARKIFQGEVFPR